MRLGSGTFAWSTSQQASGMIRSTLKHGTHVNAMVARA